MKYTIKDNNGNLICSVEDVNPIRSNEFFGFGKKKQKDKPMNFMDLEVSDEEAKEIKQTKAYNECVKFLKQFNKECIKRINYLKFKISSDKILPPNAFKIDISFDYNQSMLDWNIEHYTLNLIKANKRKNEIKLTNSIINEINDERVNAFYIELLKTNISSNYEESQKIANKLMNYLDEIFSSSKTFKLSNVEQGDYDRHITIECDLYPISTPVIKNDYT